MKKRLDFKFIHSRQQKACYFPTALPLWVVARPLGGFRCRAENAWTEAVKPLGSSTRLPIHTLSVCLFAISTPILQSFHVVSKLILSHTHKKKSIGGLSVPKFLPQLPIFFRTMSEAQAWPTASSDDNFASLFSPISWSVPCLSLPKLQQYCYPQFLENTNPFSA